MAHFTCGEETQSKMNPLFLKSGRSFPLLYPSAGMKGEPLMGVVDTKWFPLPFAVASIDVPLSHELHARTDHIVDIVPAGTKCGDLSASVMLDRARLWKYVKFVPLMSFDEFLLTVGCNGRQRSVACGEAAARLSAGSGNDRRLAESSTQMNQHVDPLPIIVAVIVFLVIIAVIAAAFVNRTKENVGN
jgi:hypothetical protein